MMRLIVKQLKLLWLPGLLRINMVLGIMVIALITGCGDVAQADSQIMSVQLDTTFNMGSSEFDGAISIVTSDPEVIDLVRELELAAKGISELREDEPFPEAVERVSAVYEMSDGSKNEREYFIPVKSVVCTKTEGALSLLEDLLNAKTVRVKRYLKSDLDAHNVKSALIGDGFGLGEKITFSPNDGEGLVAAAMLDLEEGGLGRYFAAATDAFTAEVTDAVLYVYFSGVNGETDDFVIPLLVTARHTDEWLTQHGYDGYLDEHRLSDADDSQKWLAKYHSGARGG